MNKRFVFLMAPLMLTGAATRAAGQSRHVGQFLDVAGHVEIQRPRQKLSAGRLLDPLQTGDLVRVGGGGSAQVVLFRNGARFRLAGASAARVGPVGLTRSAGPEPARLPAVSIAFVRGITRPRQPVSPRLREMLGFVVRGHEEAGLGPCHPSPSGAVRAAPVTLRWAGPVEAESLHLQISDGEHTVQEAALPPTAREFRVPAGILRPGASFVWSVTAVTGARNGTACGELVRLLSAGERAALEKLEKEAATARAAVPDDPAPLLLLAQVYQRLRLVDAARATYEAVLRTRPGDKGVKAILDRLSAEPDGGP